MGLTMAASVVLTAVLAGGRGEPSPSVPTVKPVVLDEDGATPTRQAPGTPRVPAMKPLAIPDDPATRAKFDELMEKARNMERAWWSTFRTSTGEGGRPTGADPAKQAEALKQLDEAKAEILRVTDGAEVANRFAEFNRKMRDLQRQQQEVTRDTSLEQQVRMEKWQDLNKQIMTLRGEYSEVAQRGQALDRLLWERSAHWQGVEAFKPLLKSSDEEWKVLAPKLSAVLQLQKDLRAAEGPRALGYPSGPSYLWRHPPTDTPEGALMTAAKSENPDPADLKAKLDALRKTRADAETKRNTQVADLTKKLKAAQQQLRELLTVRQEAVLVVEGILD